MDRDHERYKEIIKGVMDILCNCEQAHYPCNFNVELANHIEKEIAKAEAKKELEVLKELDKDTIPIDCSDCEDECGDCEYSLYYEKRISQAEQRLKELEE